MEGRERFEPVGSRGGEAQADHPLVVFAGAGFHVMREYAVDPLEATFVREVMETDPFTVEPVWTLAGLYADLTEGSAGRRQRLFPVLDGDGGLAGIVPWSAILAGKSDPDRHG